MRVHGLAPLRRRQAFGLGRGGDGSGGVLISYSSKSIIEGGFEPGISIGILSGLLINKFLGGLYSDGFGLLVGDKWYDLSNANGSKFGILGGKGGAGCCS